MTDTVGHLGAKGSYSHQAASQFRPDGEFLSHASFEDLVNQAEAGALDYIVLPIENSDSGRIPEVYRLLSRMELFLVAEILLTINHCLVSCQTASLKSVKKILSHPQGFIQTSEFLRQNFADTENVPNSDTATAVKEAVELNDPSVAGIGSEFAAEIYSGRILHTNIANTEDNTTRFVVASRNPSEDMANNMSSLLFQVSHVPGSLVKALEVFGKHGLNFTKLESYMISKVTSQPTFYIDVGRGSHDQRFVSAVEELREHASFIKFLGSYRTDPRREEGLGFLVP